MQAAMDDRAAEHSRATSNAPDGSASTPARYVSSKPSAPARARGPVSTSDTATRAAPRARAANAASSPIGPAPDTTTDFPDRSPASVQACRATASGSANAARLRSSPSGRRRRAYRGMSSSSASAPWVWGHVDALPRYEPPGRRCRRCSMPGRSGPKVAGCTVTGVPGVHSPDGSRSTTADSSWPGTSGSRTTNAPLAPS